MTVSTIKKPAPIKPIAKPAPVQSIAPQKMSTTPKLTAKQPVATISTVQMANNKEVASTETQEEALEKVMVEEPHAVVGITMGMTRNLGNFESFKFAVHLSMPCAPEEDAMEVSYSMAKDWVDQRVNAMQQDIEQQLASGEEEA